jgi:hypothetical protein
LGCKGSRVQISPSRPILFTHLVVLLYVQSSPSGLPLHYPATQRMCAGDALSASLGIFTVRTPRFLSGLQVSPDGDRWRASSSVSPRERRPVLSNSRRGMVQVRQHSRSLQFKNIEQGQPVSAVCSRCKRLFRAMPKPGERTDDLLLRMRADFDEHDCQKTKPEH